MRLRTLSKIAFAVASTITLSQSYAATSEFADTVYTYNADREAIDRFYAVHLSKEYFERELTMLDDWKQKLAAINFENLSREAKIDYLLLKTQVQHESKSLAEQYKQFLDVSSVVDFAEPLDRFISQRRRGTQPNSSQLAKAFIAASEAITHKRNALKEHPFENWQQAKLAADMVDSLQQGLEEAFNFYNHYDPQFTWWMQTPHATLSQAFNQYREFLTSNYRSSSVKDDGSGIIGHPIGKAEIEAQLRSEYIPYSAEDLIAIAKEQFDWCKEEMIKASREMGFGDDWRAALEHVKDTYVAPGMQPQTINDLMTHSVEFVEQRDLITLPPLAKETWRMIMMTPERQKINPFFTGGSRISISYPTEDMSHDDKLMSMRGNNPNFSYPTVQHELLPGHNLQYFMAQRNMPHRQSFRTPFWTEGWALYWEIVLWDKGFATTPEQKMGMLFWRIHRCARIMFSLQFHLGQITPQQAIDMLVNDVGHEYANAEAEVRRSFATSYVPLYQLAYMIGGLQFYALRNEMLEKGWTEKAFHDRVMAENSMPIELLRLLIQDKPIPQDYRTQWRFSTDFKAQ